MDIIVIIGIVCLFGVLIYRVWAHYVRRDAQNLLVEAVEQGIITPEEIDEWHKLENNQCEFMEYGYKLYAKAERYVR